MVSSLAMQKSPKGYRFYCPSHTHKVVEARNARFLEDYNTNESRSHKVVIEEVQDSTLSGRGVEPGGHIPTMAQQLPIQITTYAHCNYICNKELS